MQSVDFLPDEIRRRRERRRRLLGQLNLLVICALGLVLLGVLRQGRIQEARGQLSMLADRAGRAAEQLNLLEQLRAEQSELLLKKQVNEDMGSCVAALDVLAVITHLTPENVALRSINLETVEVEQERPSGARQGDSAGPRSAAEVAVKPVFVRRLQLRITGLAPSDVDVANFIAALAGNPLLEDIKMGYARDVEFRQRRAREFLVSCYVVR
ncbi:MAG: PilN domain-containing protein [Phycisphaerae bacterium]